MLTKSSARIITAIIDAVVTTLTAILPLVFPDPKTVQIVLPLVASYQAIAGIIIAALTVDVANEARIASNERLAVLDAHVRLVDGGSGVAEDRAAKLVADWNGAKNKI